MTSPSGPAAASPTPSVTVGAGAVVVREGRILLVRSTYGWSQGRWLVPNGGQRPGETLAACALRELREETGLAGVAGRLVAVRSLATPTGADTFVAIAVAAPEGEPTADGRETDAARFHGPADLAALAASGQIVRLHRILGEHVLGLRSFPPVQTLPARDRVGRSATATLYLF